MAARNTQHHDARPSQGPAASPGRFGLLIVLIGTYLLSAFAASRWIDALRVILFAAAALLALRNSVVAPQTARLILTAVLAGSAIMFAVSLTTETGARIASRRIPVVVATSDTFGVAMGRRGPGALPQAEKREHYARLIAQGINNSEACRIVGINRKTGKRWRHGRPITTRDGRKLHYAPVVRAGAVKREISPRYLSEDEQVQIADLRRAGGGVRAIAERLGRSPSTISRELRRNRDPGSGQYRPFTAHKLAAQRRARPRAGKIGHDVALRQFVQDRLEERWSPQQISQALRTEFPGDAARHVVHETIYQAVYRPELGGLSRELPARALRTRRRRRRPHRRAGERARTGSPP